MNKAKFKNTEWSILICTILLVIIGLIALYSSTISSELEEFKKQVVWLVISIPILICVKLIDYRFLSKISAIFYGLSIILLVGVLLTGKINGATSWFALGPVSIQPGEFAKVAVVLFLATVLDKINRRTDTEINKPLKLLLMITIVAIPVFLIILQPDYGTAAAYIIATALMLFVSGINKKYIIISFALIIIIVPLLYFFVLPEHAKDRINVYLNPYSDPRGAGYNIIQSKLAIGAGRLTGQGFLQGTQTHLGFLYPKTTDFIFSVIGEEFGFVLCITIVIIYVVLITKSINIAKTASDNLGSYLAIGITGILLFHVVENIGMTMGLLPITGIPLPFISYGGSALMTDMICIGLLLNISSRKQRKLEGISFEAK